jgi:hypothetical protein
MMSVCSNLWLARPRWFRIGVFCCFRGDRNDPGERMPRGSKQSSDRVDTDGIGRAARCHQRAGQAAPELPGTAAQARAGKRGSGGPSPSGTGQRVIVKAHGSRHKGGTARANLARQVSYLGRKGTSADGKPGMLYDASREAINAKQETVQWVTDWHHFRLIVSPERGTDNAAQLWQETKINGFTGSVYMVRRQVCRWRRGAAKSPGCRPDQAPTPGQSKASPRIPTPLSSPLSPPCPMAWRAHCGLWPCDRTQPR